MNGLTPDLIVLVAGLLLAAVFDFVPRAKKGFDKLSVEGKRLVNAGGVLVVVVAVFGFNCLGWAGGLGIPPVVCDQPGALYMVRLFILGIGMNYATHAVNRSVTKKVSTRA